MGTILDATPTDCLLTLRAFLKAAGTIGLFTDAAARCTLVAQIHLTTVAVVDFIAVDPGTALGALSAVPLR